jgi:biopolymer transport protein ExbB/TolQ
MRSSILAGLLVMGLVCGGCTSLTELTQKTDALAKQNRDLVQRLDAQDKAMRDLTTKVDDIAKIIEKVEQQSENQGRANRRIEAQLQQLDRGGPDNAGMKEKAAEWRERQLAQLSETLKLTDDQKEKTKTIMNKAQENMGKTMAEMRQSGSIDRDKVREAREKIRNDTTEAMKGILAPDQMDGYKKYLDALEKAQQGRRGGDRHDEQNNPGDAQPPTPK